MAAHGDRPGGKPSPPFDESLVINSRLLAVEREQVEERKKDEDYKRRQLQFNKCSGSA
jgi:hypothetical protein